MAVYVAMEPPGAGQEEAVLVRDGFTLLAFVAPVLWFLWHRMWIEAALALVVTLALGSLDALGGIAGPLASFLVSLLIGLEAPALRLWNLRRRGWRELGVAEGEGLAEAEVRFFRRDGEDEPVQAPFPPPPQFGRPERRGDAPVLGFLDRKDFIRRGIA